MDILKAWGMEDVDSIMSRIYIPCGKRIFNIKDAIKQGESEMEELTNAVPVLH